MDLFVSESLWRGQFGNDYTTRTRRGYLGEAIFLSRALRCVDRLNSIVEFGAGNGTNIEALKELYPKAELWAVEINEAAATEIRCNVVRGSMLAVRPPVECDLAFTKGVLIHIEPEYLPLAYEQMYHASRRWILIAEYYSPKPRVIPYRGQENALWARDFAGEMLDQYPTLRLVDYGFWYRRSMPPQDDISWFLMCK